MSNAYLRRIRGSSVNELKLDDAEVDARVLPPDDGEPLLDERSPDEIEKEVNRVKLLGMLAPSKGAIRERLDRVEAAEKASPRIALHNTEVLDIGPLWKEFAANLASEAHRANQPHATDLFNGGREVGSDTDHGRPRLLDPAEVAVAAKALAALPSDDPRVARAVKTIATFLETAVAKGEGILQYVL